MAARPKAVCAKCGQLRAMNILQDRSVCDSCWKSLSLEELPATDGQLALLRKHGVTLDRFITQSEATNYIRMVRVSKPATDAQLSYLESLGVPFHRPISLQEASDLLELAVPISYYVRDFRFSICEDPRSVNGRYLPGKRLGRDDEFIDQLLRRVFRFIWETSNLRDAVIAIEDGRAEDSPISVKEVESRIQRYAAEECRNDNLATCFSKFLKWLFG